MIMQGKSLRFLLTQMRGNRDNIKGGGSCPNTYVSVWGSNKYMSNLSLSNIIKLNMLFLHKRWKKDINGINIFDEFASTLSDLTDDQKEMLFTLTNEYTLVSLSEYNKFFFQAFDDAFKYAVKKGVSSIKITPLLPEKDFGKSKSSQVVFYQLKAIHHVFDEKYKDVKISFIGSPSTIDKVKKNELICLVDDFSGTGETAEEAIGYYDGKGIPLNQIIVVTLFSMSEGKNALDSKGIKLFTSQELLKGISDRTDGKRDRYLAEMNSIEQRIGVGEDLTYGYGHSEALISLCRTPNNTFPIFWLKNEMNEHPPFRR